MNPQQYHVVFSMRDEYKRIVGFDIEYFGPGPHVPFERYRKHDRATIRQRLDQAVQQKKLAFAKESDQYTALMLLVRNGTSRFHLHKFRLAIGVG